MKVVLNAAVLVLLLTVATASAVRITMEPAVTAYRAHRTNGWVVSNGVVDGSSPLRMIFAVKQQPQQIQQLHDLLMAVSHPDSPQYGKHISRDEANAIVVPPADRMAAVRSWILSFDVDADRLTQGSDYFVLEATVSLAEAMLNCKYHLYRHSTENIEAIRTMTYSLPSEVASLLDFVTPTVRLPSLRPLRVNNMANGRTPSLRDFLSPRVADTLPSSLIDPPLPFNMPDGLRALYKATGVFASQPTNLQAVASFLEQYYSPSDLQEFFFLFQNTSLGRKAIDKGTNKPSDPGMEAELDVQYIMSIGANVATQVWYTPGRAPTNPDNEPFLEWVLNVAAETTVPAVISISYGEDEKSVGYDYASRINTEFMKLGTRGVSIMVASGDSGTGGNCTSSRFTPDFPAGSPYITAVGGTIGGNATHTPTGEMTDFISGGGFSDWWDTPDWQKDAVNYYFKNCKTLPDAKNYNASGRGYPDVAAQSEMFVVVLDMIPLPGVGGTSCASPTFSGIISLLNDVRIKAGKSTLGFLNPLIYKIAPSNPFSFNDVIIGENQGCGLFGFSAYPQWDPTTGWGSPNYSILSKLVQQLP